MQIHTKRLTLVAANAALAQAEIADRAIFGAALNADIPPAWPPESIADALPWFASQLAADPTLEGWLGWYGIARDAGETPTLVASAGFLGAPTEGAVEIGYSVLPEFQRRGYAKEMVEALVEWALAQPGVERVAATVKSDNEASIRVLLRADFAFVGDSAEAEHLRFERWHGPVLMAKPYYLSDMPVEAVETEGIPSSASEVPGRRDYMLGGERVGYRYFEEDGTPIHEWVFRNERPCGRMYEWDSSGAMTHVQSYDEKGMAHGTAYQWDDDGRLIGSYTMDHGTGVDLWWAAWSDGKAELAEVHFYREGSRYGYEWWLGPGGTPYSERHWYDSKQHGIEREWNDKDRLKRGFPRYWIHDERVTKPRYLRAAAKDDTLPSFRIEENLPYRKFPPEVEERVKLHG